MHWKRPFFLLGVLAAALQAAPQLQLSTTALGPFNIAQNASGPTQTVTANNIGTGSLTLAVTASSSWLQPSVVGGTTIQIALNTSSLPPGSYTEFVTVSSPGAINAPQNISVTIKVGGVPSTLTYYAAPGGAAITQQVVTQAMPSSVQSTTLTGSGWLAVSLSLQGSFTSYFPYNVTVTPQTGQSAGTYTGTVTFSGSSVASDNKQVGVTLNLTSSPIQQFSPTSVQLYSAGTVKATSAVTAYNSGAGTLTISSVTGSASWLTGSVSGSTVTVTADPTGLAAGSYQGILTFNSNAANAAAAVLPVEFIVEPNNTPILSFGGVVDNATFGPTLSPGMIAQAYGVLLSGTSPTLAASLPLSTNLGNVQVSVNGIPAPVYYASTGVVDFVVPFEVQPGPGTVTLTYNGVSSNTVSTTIAARAPKLLYFPLAESGQTFYYGIIVNSSDGSFPVPTTAGLLSHPAKPGDTLTIYGLGFGLTNQSVADGAASPSSPLAVTPVPSVILGGGFAGTATDGTVLFSGLTPGSVGLYQINLTLPADSPIGNAIALEIQLTDPSTNAIYTSNPVYLAISH